MIQICGEYVVPVTRIKRTSCNCWKNLMLAVSLALVLVLNEVHELPSIRIHHFPLLSGTGCDQKIKPLAANPFDTARQTESAEMRTMKLEENKGTIRCRCVVCAVLCPPYCRGVYDWCPCLRWVVLDAWIGIVNRLKESRKWFGHLRTSGRVQDPQGLCWMFSACVAACVARSGT